MHKCALCLEKFDIWMLYQVHTESHKLMASVDKLTTSKARNTVGVKKPLSDEQLAKAIDQGERRMGSHNFYGGTV